jgi:hypothetical protein
MAYFDYFTGYPYDMVKVREPGAFPLEKKR